jgi:hypothetical protein
MGPPSSLRRKCDPDHAFCVLGSSWYPASLIWLPHLQDLDTCPRTLTAVEEPARQGHDSDDDEHVDEPDAHVYGAHQENPEQGQKNR